MKTLVKLMDKVERKLPGDPDNGLGFSRSGEEINYIDIFVEPGTLVSAVYGADSSVTPENTFINGTYDVTSSTDNTLFIYTNGYE